MSAPDWLAALKAAGSDADVLAALACGFKAEAKAPTPQALAAWWPECPDAVRSEADERLRQLVALVVPDLPDDVPSVGFHMLEEGQNTLTGGRDRGLVAALPVRVVHIPGPVSEWSKADRGMWGLFPTGPLRLSRLWLHFRTADPDNCPNHPLSPIVWEWIEAHPQPAKVYHVKTRANLPDFDRDGPQLIDDYTPDAFEAKDPQPFLPGFEPDGDAVPHWLLHWFRATGGPISQGGRLPLELSLMVGGMARLRIGDRDGRWRTIRLPHRTEHEDEERFEGLDSLERWLWPDGWGKNRYSRWRMIPEALHRLRRGWAGWLAVPGIGRVAVLAPSVIPERRADPLVELTVRIPRSAANGARFDWPLFTRYGVKSATLARGYLSASAHLHRSAHKGHPITRLIAAPILGADGEPIRRKGGKIVRSATEREANPSARFVAALSDVDLARMIGYRWEKAGGRRKRQGRGKCSSGWRRMG